MKATELKIGDWVSYKGKPAKICSLDMYAGCGVCKVDDVSSNNRLDPIPLTAEILEKNGWKKATYSSSKGQSVLLTKDFCDNIDWITIAFYKQGIKAEICQQGKRLSIPISYVHQLQHLLWALEIDDDLKI